MVLQVRKGLRITGALVQLLLLAKAVAVAVTAPENVWPASEPAGNVGLLAMYLAIGVAVLGTGVLQMQHVLCCYCSTNSYANREPRLLPT